MRWVIDPIDGTVNYLYGLQDWAVSIAAEVCGVVLAGAVVLPRHGEPFTAVRGGGAWLDAGTGDRIALRCGPGVPLAGPGGHRVRVPRGAAQGPGRGGRGPAAPGARHPAGGLASVDLCSVAAGRVDAYYERGLNYWDYAAGALIAAEAGAVVAGLGGAPPSTSMTIAAGPELFGALASLRPGWTRNATRDWFDRPWPGQILARNTWAVCVVYQRPARSGRTRLPRITGRVRAGRERGRIPAGIGHNYGFRSVKPAQRPRYTYGGGWVTQWLLITTARARQTTT